MASKNKKKSKKVSAESSASSIETSIETPKKIVAPVTKTSSAPPQTKRLLPHNLLMEIDRLSERLISVEKQLEELKSKM